MDLPPHPVTGKEGFSSGFRTKDVTILVVTGILGWGVDPIDTRFQMISTYLLRKLQHTPQTYPRHPQTLKRKEFRNINCCLGGLGYVPGVCW